MPAGERRPASLAGGNDRDDAHVRPRTDGVDPHRVPRRLSQGSPSSFYDTVCALFYYRLILRARTLRLVSSPSFFISIFLHLHLHLHLHPSSSPFFIFIHHHPSSSPSFFISILLHLHPSSSPSISIALHLHPYPRHPYYSYFTSSSILFYVACRFILPLKVCTKVCFATCKANVAHEL